MSPMAADVSGRKAKGVPRKPGQHAFSVANRLAARYFVLIFAGLSIVLAAWLILKEPLWLVLLVQVTGIAVILTFNRIYWPQIDNWMQGGEGEVKVGKVLDRMKDEGWLPIHNVSFGGADIDHVVIGPGGIFTIETKSYPGALSIERIYPKSLYQAKNHKKRLEEITGYKIEPLLVFSQAWLRESGISRRRGVVILSARMLEGFLERRKPVVTAARAKQVHERLLVAVSAS